MILILVVSVSVGLAVNINLGFHVRGEVSPLGQDRSDSGMYTLLILM